jgi:hypothetical protein
MNFTSKFQTRARIVAIAVLMSGALPNLAFAAYSSGGSPHAPFLTRIVPDKVQAVRPTNGIAADHPVAGNPGTRPTVFSLRQWPCEARKMVRHVSCWSARVRFARRPRPWTGTAS